MSKRHWNKRINEIFEDLEKEIADIWAVYEMHPNDVIVEEVNKVIQEVKERYK